MSEEFKDIPARAKLMSFARSFLIQAAWNNERMQNVGFAYSLSPLLDGRGEEDSCRILESHLNFFNTHPYLAGALIGAVGKMEHDNRKPEEIKSFKQGVMGAFGALGDSLFWCAMKPAAMLVGVSIAIGGHWIWAIAVTMIFYNSLHLWARMWGFYHGVNLGRMMLNKFTKIHFARSTALLGLTAVMLLAMITTWGGMPGEPLVALIGGNYLVAGAMAGAIVWLCSEATNRGLGSETLFYLAGGISIAANMTIGK